MRAKRDNIAEIEQIRNRTLPSDWDNGITKLFLLMQQTQRLEDAEHNAYFIVASIAAIQSYFRGEIRRLIDSGEKRYIDNFRLHDSFRISKDHLVAVHNRRVTIGELIAHSVRLSDVSAISDTIGHLLNTDFVSLVKEARDPESRRKQGNDAPTILRSFADTKIKLDRAFELRNIICHEAHLDSPVKAEEAKTLCASCFDFVLASHYGIEHFHDPSPPMTLSEAFSAAGGRIEVIELRLKEEEGRIILGLHSPLERAAFEQMQQSWRAYVRHEGEYNASLHMNGNRGLLQEQIATEQLYKRRLDDLANIGLTKGRRFG